MVKIKFPKVGSDKIINGFTYSVAVLTLASYVFMSTFMPTHKDTHATSSIPAAPTCTSQTKTTRVTIKDNHFSPDKLTVKQCDSVTITNDDIIIYEPAFGEHENHLHYPGFNEAALRPGKSVQFYAAQKGDFEIHDHIHDLAEMSLTVE